MTREERLDWLCRLRSNLVWFDVPPKERPVFEQVLSEVIKALEQEPCEDAISREEVLNILATWGESEYVYKSIFNLPSITPTRKKGKWIAEYDPDGHFRTYHCSNCKNLQGYTSNFCEECGSENREVEE